MSPQSEAKARRPRKHRVRVRFFSGQKLRNGRQLKAARALAGLRPVELSKLSGVGVNTLRRMEGQNRITSSRLKVEPLERVLEAAGIEIFVEPHLGVRLRDGDAG